MKKFLIAAVLVAFAVSSAYALDINAAAEPDFTAAGFVSWADTFAVGSALPTGFLMFTGSGDEFWVEFAYRGTLQSAPTAVPGNIILPAPEPERNGSTWIYSAYINCATDSVAIYPVFR